MIRMQHVLTINSVNLNRVQDVWIRQHVTMM